MSQRLIIVFFLVITALGSTWLLNIVSQQRTSSGKENYHEPDYYMEDFTTVTMKQDGTPKSSLYAVHMAHYPDNDTSELLQPKMELFRNTRLPLYVSADKGWVTSDNEVILLEGNVQLWEDDAFGNRILQVNTSSARVLIEQNTVTESGVLTNGSLILGDKGDEYKVFHVHDGLGLVMLR